MNEPREKASDIIYSRLSKEALDMDRPEVRQGTLERLAQACNDISVGRAAKIVKEAYGKDFGLKLNPKVTPSSVDRYVRARRIKDASWTGPTRAFIQNDPSLLAFVRAYEDERAKPHTPRRSYPSRRRLEEAIETISNDEDRIFVRLELEKLRRTRRELEVLREGLRKMPPIGIERILNRETDDVQVESKLASTLRPLVVRLLDYEDMSRVGLEMVDGRLISRTTRQAIVKKAEMDVLLKSVGMASKQDK